MEWVLLAIVVAVVLYAVVTYNGLVSLRQRVTQAFADIDVQLKQRHDLIPNLVETVKGYATHERGTLEAVVQARNAALTASGPAQQAAAEGALSGALGRLMALAEAYPDLKANTNFQQLQSELSDVENKLAAARRFFNNAVSEYNASIESFPAVLFARPMGFTRARVLRRRRDAASDARRRPAGQVLAPTERADGRVRPLHAYPGEPAKIGRARRRAVRPRLCPDLRLRAAVPGLGARPADAGRRGAGLPSRRGPRPALALSDRHRRDGALGVGRLALPPGRSSTPSPGRRGSPARTIRASTICSRTSASPAACRCRA